MDPPPNFPAKINRNPRSPLILLLFTLSLITILPFLTLDFSFFLNPISISSQCKIVSTSVDIRSSKVCELGVFNFNAKNVFYPSQNNKFRCRHDYYWASVFQVEYKEYSSGYTRHASAEAPKEALPIGCRPSFVAAWSTKEKFKVNETYNCRYTPGISLVDIDSDSLFNCRVEDPPIAEMVERNLILLTELISLLLSEVGRTKLVIPNLLAGIFTGLFTALVSVSLVGILLIPKPRLVKTSETTTTTHGKRVCIRVCVLVAYFSLLVLFTLYYGKMIGLTKIFHNY